MDSKEIARLAAVLKELRAADASWPFLLPVDWKGMGLDDYPVVISEPMDLKTVTEVYKLAIDMEKLTATIKSNTQGSEISSLQDQQHCPKLSDAAPVIGPPRNLIMFCERLGLLDSTFTAVVIRMVAEKASACLKPKDSSQDQFDFDVGLLYTDFPNVYKQVHGVIALAAYGKQAWKRAAKRRRQTATQAIDKLPNVDFVDDLTMRENSRATVDPPSSFSVLVAKCNETEDTDGSTIASEHAADVENLASSVPANSAVPFRTLGENNANKDYSEDKEEEEKEDISDVLCGKEDVSDDDAAAAFRDVTRRTARDEAQLDGAVLEAPLVHLAGTNVATQSSSS